MRGGGAGRCASVVVASIIASLDRASGALRVALALSVLHPHSHPGGLVVGGIEQHHVRDVDRPLLVDDPAGVSALLGVLDRARPLVALHHVQALDVDAPSARLGAQHAAGLAAVLAGGDEDGVVLADLHPLGHRYSTSGARETIFMKLRSRNSRATGPKIRVPRGFCCGSISTAAFSSKAM